MTRYLNIKSSYGIETVDELRLEDFPTRKLFLTEIRRLVSEYNIAGMAVYISQRCTADWKTN